MNQNHKTFSKNECIPIAVCIFTIIFTGIIIYEIWITDDPSICKRKACVVMGWGIRASLIGIPIGITIFVLKIITSPYEPYKEPEPKKEEPFDYSKMGANNI